MNILIIEDDPTKSKMVETFLSELNINNLLIKKQKSWQSGLIEIINNRETYNFLILDMSMPRYDPEVADTNKEFEIYAGWEILKEMKRLNINIPTCVFTSYDYFGEGKEVMERDTINKKLELEFPIFYVGMIYFRTTDLSWKEKIRSLMMEVLDY